MEEVDKSKPGRGRWVIVTKSYSEFGSSKTVKGGLKAVVG